MTPLRFTTALLVQLLFACTFSTLHAEPVEVIPATLHGAMQPQIAVAPSGTIHVTFGKDGVIFYTISHDRGRTFSSPAKVGALPKLALGLRRGPRIAATDRIVVITAISHADGDLHAWTSANGGATWSESKHVNSPPNSAREGLHAMTADGAGNVFATWLDDGSGGKELWRALSSDGGRTWGESALIYKSPDGHICECCNPSAAMDAQGHVSVMWRNWLGGSRDMFTAASGDGGKTFSSAKKLGSGTWKLNGCPMDGGALALAADGKPLAVWRREKAVFASIASDPEQALSDSAVQPIAVSTGPHTFIFWQSGGDLLLKKDDTTPARIATNAAFAAAAPMPDGAVIVVWESSANGTKTILSQFIPK